MIVVKKATKEKTMVEGTLNGRYIFKIFILQLGIFIKKKFCASKNIQVL